MREIYLEFKRQIQLFFRKWKTMLLISRDIVAQ